MMSVISDSRTPILRELPIFALSSEEELHLIDALVDEIEVEPDEVILRENETGRESFIIVSGTAHVTLSGVSLTDLGPGDLFGEMALLDGKPRAATVTATSAMHLLVVDEEDFGTLLTQPGVAGHMLRSIATRLRNTQDVRDPDLSPSTKFEPLDSTGLSSRHVWREPVRGSYPGNEFLELSGREVLDRFHDGRIARAPISRLTGMLIEEVADNRVSFTMPASDWFLSSQEHISAGALMILADAAFGSAVMLGLPPGAPFSTSEMSVTFLKPCPPGGTLRVIGEPVSDGRPLAISQAWIEDGNGDRIAFGTSTCFVRDANGARPNIAQQDLSEPNDPTPDPYLRDPNGEVIDWDLWRSMSGQELLARQIAGELPNPPIHYLTGLTLREAQTGKVTFTLPAHQWLTTGMRTVEGGVIAMLAHAALATAVTSTLEPGAAYRPVDVKINFLRPVFGDGTELVATGAVTHRGKTLAVATADVVGPGGKKVATATGSTMIVGNRD